jgi:hypothetical protein
MAATILPPKDAVRAAIDFYRENVGLAADSLVQTEEIEFRESPSGPEWLITLSFPPLTNPNPIAALAGRRAMKVFTVDAATGNVRSMKIRAAE